MLRISVFFMVTYICLFANQAIRAQTGPGGIGNSSTNVLWLRADDLSSLSDGAQVATWSDQSGNGNDATQSTSSYQPTLQQDELNGFPVVQLDGSDDYFDDAHSYDVRTVYGAFRISSTLQSTSKLGQFWGSYNEQIHVAMDARNGNRRGFSVDGGTPLNTFQGTISYNGSNFTGFVYNSNTYQWTYDQEALFAVEYESTKGVTRQVIGSLVPSFSVGTHQYGGDIAEIIVYDTTHTEVERTIIENYLATKYNITLSVDLYSYDTSHPYQLIGIGQASDGTNHTNSTGDGILTLSTPSTLSDGDYFLVAHDGGEAELVDTCDAPGEYGKRLERVWKVGHTGDLGTVSFSFDLSGVTGLGSVSDLALIQSSTSDFTSATLHTTGINLVGSTLSFTDVDLNDGDIFTIAQLGSTVIWDGASWANGSGGSSAPSTTDASKKMLISGTGATISSDASCECAQIASGMDLSIDSNITLTVANGITNDGDVVVASSGSIVQTSTTANTGSGNYEIQRNSGTINDDRRYQYWSSPVQSTTMGTVFTGSNTVDFYYFDNSTDTWASQSAGATMTPGIGYITTGTIGISNTSETRIFNGTINNATVTVSTTNASIGENILIGNPYPSAINSTTFVADNTGINGTLWFWNHFTPASNGIFQSDYATWTMTGATTGNGSELPDDYIQSCQGFFVEALTANPTITFNNDQRNSGNNSQFFKRSDEQEKHRVWLALTNDSNDFNQLLIGFLPEASDGLDRLYDGKKFKAHPRLSFYSILDSSDYSIQGLELPEEQEGKRIPLGVDAWITGDFTIYIDSLDNWPEHYSIHLIDEQKFIEHDLRMNPRYTFQVESTRAIRDRFYIAVRNEMETGTDTIIDQPTSVQETVLKNDVKVFTTDGDIVVTSKTRELSGITIHDIAGRLLLDQELKGHTARIPVQESTGVTIVSVKFNDTSYHKQLLVR